MKTSNKRLAIILASLFVVTISAITSCSKEGGSGGLTGYYTDLNKPAKQSDFNELNTAINNGELLTSYHYGGQTHNYWADYDLFINEEGRYDDSDPHCGRLRWAIKNTQIKVIHIIDKSTLTVYYANLYVDNSSGANSREKVYKLYAGSIFGNMAYCDNPTYYTYVKEDNKIVVSNGDIYTITSNGLIKDGSSSLLSKYDPTKRY